MAAQNSPSVLDNSMKYLHTRARRGLIRSPSSATILENARPRNAKTPPRRGFIDQLVLMRIG